MAAEAGRRTCADPPPVDPALAPALLRGECAADARRRGRGRRPTPGAGPRRTRPRGPPAAPAEARRRRRPREPGRNASRVGAQRLQRWDPAEHDRASK